MITKLPADYNYTKFDELLNEKEHIIKDNMCDYGFNEDGWKKQMTTKDCFKMDGCKPIAIVEKLSNEVKWWLGMNYNGSIHNFTNLGFGEKKEMSWKHIDSMTGHDFMISIILLLAGEMEYTMKSWLDVKENMLNDEFIEKVNCAISILCFG